MTITLFGIVVSIIGTIVLIRGSTLAMLQFVMGTSMLGGTASINFSTGSSVLPGAQAVLFLVLRCALPTKAHRPALGEATGAFLPLLVFTGYGVAGIFILPFLFEGAMQVAPLRPVFVRNPFTTVPLEFTAQNLTSAGYVLITCFGAMSAFIAVQRDDAPRRLARTIALIAIGHALLGLLSVALARTDAAAVFDFFRNAQYNQLDQDIGGFSRMNGVFAEPSNYAAFGFCYFAVSAELWRRDIERNWTGPAALLLGGALLFSTSTTAYLGLAIYAAMMLLRQMLFPGAFRADKAVAMTAVAAVAVVALLGLIIAQPLTLEAIEQVYRMTITTKTETESGLVRAFWARQGIEAFWVSGGLGVGLGSFRSSSLLTAILGSTGVIGITAYVAQLVRIFRPLAMSTYHRVGAVRADAGAALAWGVIAMAVPSYFASPTPDPGLTWGLLAGAALGFRLSRSAPGPQAAAL